METTKPHEWREDPWIVATKILTPCYIGGWSACEQLGLAKQILREIVVFTSRPLGHHVVRVQETTFRIKGIGPEKMFGTKVVWRKQVRLHASDPSRTVADILDDPPLGGGMKNVADIVGGVPSWQRRRSLYIKQFRTSRLTGSSMFEARVTSRQLYRDVLPRMAEVVCVELLGRRKGRCC